MFAESSNLTNAYLELKFGKPTKEACKAVMKQAAAVIDGCKAAKQEVYDNGPKVHGAAQQSRLDLLDIWEMKASAVYDNAMDMMSKALN